MSVLIAPGQATPSVISSPSYLSIMQGGKWQVTFTLTHSSAAATGSLEWVPVIGFDDGNNGALYFHNATLACSRSSDGADMVTAALTWSAGATLVVTVDVPLGQMTISGATTGNGTYTGSTWAWTGTNVYYGRDAGSGVINGTMGGVTDFATGSTGTTSGSGTLTGTLTGRGELTGTASGSGSVTGTLTGTASTPKASQRPLMQPLAARGLAAAMLIPAPAPVLYGQGLLKAERATVAAATGTAQGSGAATGTITATGALSGSTAGTGTATATATGRGALSGSTAGTGTASGTATGVGALSGSTTGTGTANGTAAGAGALTGAAGGTGAATGTLAGAGALTGAAAGAGTATGTLTGTGALTGTTAGTGTATASTDGTRQLTGTAAGVGTATGTLSGAAAATGTTQGTGTPSGTLAGAGALTGSATGTGTPSGTAQGSGALAGTAAGSGTAAATGSGAPGGMSGTSSGTGTATATLSGRGAIVGASTGSSTATIDNAPAVVEPTGGDIYRAAIPGTVGSVRRYYLGMRLLARDYQDPTELVWAAKQLNEPGHDLPADFPLLTRLAAQGYTTFEDLAGASASELRLRGFTAREAAAVLAAAAAAE